MGYRGGIRTDPKCPQENGGCGERGLKGRNPDEQEEGTAPWVVRGGVSREQKTSSESKEEKRGCRAVRGQTQGSN